MNIGKGLNFDFTVYDNRFSMDIIFPTFFSVNLVKKHTKILNSLFNYSCFKFYLRQLTEGEKIIEEIKNNKYPFDDKDVLLFKYNDKSAILNSFICSNSRYEIKPAMIVFGGDIYGFTVTPGNFSDLVIYKQGDERFAAYTKDFIPYMASLTAIFLKDYMKVVEDFSKGKIPDDFDEQKRYSDYFINPQYNKIINEIKANIDERTVINKNKRIDMLKVNNKTVLDLMIEKGISYRYFIDSNDIIAISLEMKKPIMQVKKYIEKTLDKKYA